MLKRYTLPDKYLGLNEALLRKRIKDIKERLGSDLCILGHYYERDEVIEFADFEGDSFALAKAGAKTAARWIVFCGVHFMAEASVVLASKGQRVFLPDMDAGCPLADMATIDQVKRAWQDIEEKGLAKEFLPVVYMNSTAELKAFCGRNGGLVCTSSSVHKAFKWVFDQGKRVLFFPDENLGRNAARAMNIPDTQVALWDRDEIDNARVVVWNGFCHVHTFFNRTHIDKARKKYPDCKIVVHPECNPEVVDLSDGSGSTAYLKEFAENSPSGSTVIIGTEINLVARLAKLHPDKKILPLARSLCPNMFKISLADLCWTLECLGDVNEVFVPENVALDARLALGRMLKL